MPAPKLHLPHLAAPGLSCQKKKKEINFGDVEHMCTLTLPPWEGACEQHSALPAWSCLFKQAACFPEPALLSSENIPSLLSGFSDKTNTSA